MSVTRHGGGAALLALILCVLVGCSTPAPTHRVSTTLETSEVDTNLPPVPEIVPPPVAEAAPVPEPVVPETPEPVLPKLVPPPVARTNQAIVAPTPPPITNSLPPTWMPLRQWTRDNRLPRPEANGVPPLISLTSHTPAGVMEITLGSRYIRWNGLNIGIGFAPLWYKNEPYLHGLDAEKTLSPLLNSGARDPKPIKTLVLDPGHGGSNFGTKSYDGRFYEKDLALDWARRVKIILHTRRPDWTVYLTRTNDSDLSLTQRVAFADSVRADLFVSLHFNAVGSNREESGMETYCATPTGLPSNLVREFEDNPARVSPNNAFDLENFQYALRLHRNLVQYTGRKDRGLRRARFMTVLREQSRPAVLLEGGYLSNPREAKLIYTPEFRQRLAEAVVEGLLSAEGGASSKNGRAAP